FCFAELWECVRVLAPLFGTLLAPSAIRGHRLTRSRCILAIKKCSGRDLNPHAFRHTPLKRTCLPFHHPSFVRERQTFRRRQPLASGACVVVHASSRVVIAILP